MKNSTEFNWINHGSFLIQKDPWLAQKLISEGIKKSPYTPIAYIKLGICLRTQKRYREALRAYDLGKKLSKYETKN